MIQKAILQIDSSKGVRKNASAGSRFRASDSVAAMAADRLKQGASGKNGTPQDRALVENDTITVQYNPASIRYHASTSTQKTAEPDVGTSTEMVTSITTESTVDMSFELVFHNTGDDDDSTKEQMELVMNMLYDSPTRQVRFAWGKLEVTGKLVSFSGEYDMFDASGRPVSGHMKLTIRTETSVRKLDKTIDELGKARKDKPAAQGERDNGQNEENIQGT